MAKAVFIILAFALGLAVDRLLLKPLPGPTVVESDPKCENLATAKNDLLTLSKSEYQEYTQIKDLKQKYEKADELLGKVMLLFLADVGFRAQKVSAAELITPLPAPAPTASHEISHELSTVATPPINSTNLGGRSGRIYSARSSADIQRVLDSAVIANMRAEAAMTDYPTAQQIKVVEGIFNGEIQLFDKKRESIMVTWVLHSENSRTKRPTGRFNLTLTSDKRNSETSGNGEFGNISMINGDRNAFLVKACGDTCYLQLYYNSPNDRFYGNYYESEDLKNYTRTGLISLKR